jgi:hypothetical protein
MPAPRPYIFPSLLLVTGSLLADAADAPRLAVEQGTVLRKVFVTTWDMDLESLSVTFDGEEVQTGDEISIEQDERQRIEIVDSYRAVKGERVTELVRRFESLESESKTDTTSPEGNELTEQSKTSGLEGLEVLFRWDAEQAAYVAEFVGDGGDGELLEDLQQDVDLAGFLPDGDVEVDASWTIQVDEVRKLLSPGGDLAFVDEDDEDDDEDGDLEQQFEDNLSGEMTATYRGLRDVDGQQVASIELAGEFETEAERDDGGDGVTGTATLSMELAGELLWDMEGGYFHSIHLSGPCAVEFGSKMGGGQHEFEQIMTFSGTFELAGEVTRGG